MAEAYFYHLDGIAAEDLLPDLLQRGLARGVRLAVETADLPRLVAFSTRLWSHEDTSFLAHGQDGEPNADRQLIWLTVGADNPNRAAYRFYFGGAWPSDDADFERMFLLFDGSDETERSAARQQWKDLKARDIAVKYWKKDETGRWAEQA